MLKSNLLLGCSIVAQHALAQPVDPPRFPFYSCKFPKPDSVDVSGDGIADLVVVGMVGISTCDIPVSVGNCHVVVRTLPGTQLLGRSHPMGGRDVYSFAPGDTIPALFGAVQNDLQIPRDSFIDGEVRAITWTYGRSGVAPPHLDPMADRTFVYATTVGDRIAHGTFTLSMIDEERTVRILNGQVLTGAASYIVK